MSRVSFWGGTTVRDTLATTVHTAMSCRAFIVGAAASILLLAFSLIAQLSETGEALRELALLTICAFFCAILVATRRPRQAAIVTIILALTIWAVSQAKIAYLGTPFVFGDLVNMLGYNIWWTLTNYPELAIVSFMGILGLGAFAIWLVKWPGKRASFGTAFFAGSCCLIFSVFVINSSKNLAFWNQEFAGSEAGIGTFATSMVWWWHTGGNAVTIYGVADQPLDPQPEPTAIAAARKPNIFMVLNESVFDPSALDLPVENDITSYFQPANGVSGHLSVNTHGGGTWVTEFSVMSGLDTRAFGDKVFYLPTLMEDRVHHNLVQTLNDQGYRTMVVYCVDGSFMNAENFYRSLGVQEFHVPKQAADRQKVGYFRDAVLYDEALALMSSDTGASSDRPVFVLVVTISNHGPHKSKIAPDEDFPATQAWLAENLHSPEQDEYREYYLRLKQSIADHEALKAKLARQSDDRMTLLVRYGDHQPTFTKRDAFARVDASGQQLFTTYFAIEAINGELADRPDWGGGPLDVAYLPSLVLETAGLPVDQIFSVRQQLMESCQGLYFRCRDSRIDRLHRTLVDRGLIEVDHIETAAIEPGLMFH